jgi:hypothetical protein
MKAIERKIFGPTFSSKKITPQITPKTGIKKVTVKADDEPTDSINLK